MAISALSIQQITAVIRSQISAQATSAKGTRQPIAGGRTELQKGPSTALSKRGLNALITRRIAALNPDDQQRGRKAFRIFLESVLISELGDELINDAGFYDMISEIQIRMEDVPEIAALMLTAIEHLLNESR